MVAGRFPLVLGHGLSLQGVEMIWLQPAYTRALRGKDRAAPMDSPKARKKVIRAPAVSQSFDLTNLWRREQQSHTASTGTRQDPKDQD